MSNQFIPIEREQPFVIPVQDWLDPDHLARFIVSIVDSLDVSALESADRGGGSAPDPPKRMLALLFYGYATGVFTSRKLEQGTDELIPMLYITGNPHPDHDSINTFRKRFWVEMEDLLTQLLVRASAVGVLRLADVSLDGTKPVLASASLSTGSEAEGRHANASKHTAMRWGDANRREEPWRAEVQALLKKAETAGDQEPVAGRRVGEEIARRQAPLPLIGDVKTELEARAKARDDAEKAADDETMAPRQAREKQRGRKRGGRAPKPPEPGARERDHVNVTDPESRIMPVSGGGFEPCDNAQARVEHASRLIVEQHVTQHPNDRQEMTPTLAHLGALPQTLGHVKTLVGETGYCRAANAEACEQVNIIPLLAGARGTHPPSPEARFAEAGVAPPATASPMARMQHRLKTVDGKALDAKRKSTVEPVFGILKEVMGFRQFLLRGLTAVSGEWTLVCLAYTVKRLHVLAGSVCPKSRDGHKNREQHQANG
ncbi:transposase [uncultured Thiocystis sp.]|jgi:transposase|uniref:transposase n=1 Tax=uncultured Thiocystis sp. TaxID=1202134 RepID=UPI0025FA39E0|nr:transposase [uncultured Thiocystis sp.]